MKKFLICYISWRNDNINTYFTQAETMKKAVEEFRKYNDVLDDIVAISVLEDDVEEKDLG